MNCAVPERGQSVCHAMLACLIGLALLCPLPTAAQDQLQRARADMTDPDHPLLRISTARGAFFVELFPESAPASVDWFLALTGERDGTGNNGGRDLPDPVDQYAGLTFNRILPGILIQSNGPEEDELPDTLADAAPPPEINAVMLGLEQQPLLDPRGTVNPWMNIRDRSHFEQAVLAPLYRQMGIDGRSALEARRDEVVGTLRDSTVADAYQRQGYQYDDQLPSRAPRTGSLLLLAATPQRSSGRIAITLTDAPWLRGKHTVIGEVVGSMAVVRALGSEPRPGSSPAIIYGVERIID